MRSDKGQKVPRQIAVQVLDSLEKRTKNFISDVSGKEEKNTDLWYRIEIGKRPNLMEMRLTGAMATVELKISWVSAIEYLLDPLETCYEINSRNSLYIRYWNNREEAERSNTDKGRKKKESEREKEVRIKNEEVVKEKRSRREWKSWAEQDSIEDDRITVND